MNEISCANDLVLMSESMVNLRDVCGDCMHIWFKFNLYLASFLISLSVFPTMGVKYQC